MGKAGSFFAVLTVAHSLFFFFLFSISTLVARLWILVTYYRLPTSYPSRHTVATSLS